MKLAKPFDDYKTPSKVVLSLLRSYVNKGYKVTLDDVYTSPELAAALSDHKTDSFGTLRKKEGLPNDFWSWKPVKGEEPIINRKDGMMSQRRKKRRLSACFSLCTLLGLLTQDSFTAPLESL